MGISLRQRGTLVCRGWERRARQYSAGFSSHIEVLGMNNLFVPLFNKSRSCELRGGANICGDTNSRKQASGRLRSSKTRIRSLSRYLSSLQQQWDEQKGQSLVPSPADILSKKDGISKQYRVTREQYICHRYQENRGEQPCASREQSHWPCGGMT